MANKGVAALGFVLLVLLGVLAIPAVIESSNSTTVKTETIPEGESVTVTEYLEVSNSVSNSGDVTLLVTSSSSGDSITRTVGEGNTSTFNLPGGDIIITAEDTTNQGATLVIEYPNDFGYSEGAITIKNNLPVILIAMLFIAIMSFVTVKP